MDTPMQALYKALHNSHPEQWNAILLHDKERLLEQERKVIIDAASFVPDVVTYKSNRESAERYFNTTFTNL